MFAAGSRALGCSSICFSNSGLIWTALRQQLWMAAFFSTFSHMGWGPRLQRGSPAASLKAEKDEIGIEIKWWMRLQDVLCKMLGCEPHPKPLAKQLQKKGVLLQAVVWTVDLSKCSLSHQNGRPAFHSLIHRETAGGGGRSKGNEAAGHVWGFMCLE